MLISCDFSPPQNYRNSPTHGWIATIVSVASFNEFFYLIISQIFKLLFVSYFNVGV